MISHHLWNNILLQFVNFKLNLVQSEFEITKIHLKTSFKEFRKFILSENKHTFKRLISQLLNFASLIFLATGVGNWKHNIVTANYTSPSIIPKGVLLFNLWIFNLSCSTGCRRTVFSVLFVKLQFGIKSRIQQPYRSNMLQLAEWDNILGCSSKNIRSCALL